MGSSTLYRRYLNFKKKKGGKPRSLYWGIGSKSDAGDPSSCLDLQRALGSLKPRPQAL